MQNTTTVVRNLASPLGSGYWTPAVWPRDGNNHTPEEVDVGCPEDGCLFNLRLDRTERKEFSAEFPVRLYVLFAVEYTIARLKRR